MTTYYINTKPIAKPRMTRRDKWMVRPVVQKYRDYCDELRRKCPEIDTGMIELVFYCPMPSSWSKKKKDIHRGMPHEQKPDIDNLVKAVLDALTKDDSHVWKIKARKIWSEEGQVVLTY